jgi:hypothetical protein
MDPDTVHNVERLAKQLGRRLPDLTPQLDALTGAVRALEGAPVRRLLREGSRTKPAKKQAKRAAKKRT